jgi:hypothetical protein
LSSLSKLSQLKTNSSDTIQQYVVSKLFKNYPELLSVEKDLPSIESAKNIVFLRLQEDLKKLKICVDNILFFIGLEENFGLKNIIKNEHCDIDNDDVDDNIINDNNEINNYINNKINNTNNNNNNNNDDNININKINMLQYSNIQQKLIKKLTIYLNETEMLYLNSKKLLFDLLQDYKDICFYLGEDGDKVEPEFVFGEIWSFVKNISNATVVETTKAKKKYKIVKI